MSKYTVKNENIPEKLESILSVYHNGKVIFSHKFGALIISYKLSLSGTFLVVNLADSQHDDAGKVFIFNLKDNQILFSGFIDIGYISEFDFLGENEDLYATNHFGSYEIKKNGEVVDIDKVYYDAVMAADTYSIEYIEPYLESNNFSEDAIKQVVHSLDRIIDSQFNQFHGISWAATALRRRGEYLEMLNENNEALSNYIDAIFLDPKIGVKRKLATLSKKLGVNLQDIKPSDRALRIKESCEQHREISSAKSRADWEYIQNGGIETVISSGININIKSQFKDETKEQYKNKAESSSYLNSANTPRSKFTDNGRKRSTAILLALLTGFVGGHKFYLGRPIQGVLCILLVFSGLSFLWAIIDVFRLIFMSNEKFNLNYNIVNNDSGLKKRSYIETIIKTCFVLFNIVMAVYLFSIYDRAGLIIGDWSQIPLLAIPFVKAQIDDTILKWIAGDIILGLFLFFIRKKKSN